MNEDIDGFQSIFNQLTDMSEPIGENMQVAMVLYSLGDNTSSLYGHIISFLQSHTEAPSWETLMERLVQDYEENISSTNGQR